MIKIKNKLFGKKKRQPINENVKYLCNVFRNRVNRELKNPKRNTMLLTLKNTVKISGKRGKVLDP